MPTPATSLLPKPKSSDEFEDIVTDVMATRWPTTQVQRYGRSGQQQQGVDIFAQPPHLGGRYAAVQCKNVKSLSRQQIESEIAQARKFALPIAEYILATSLDRDAKLQREVAALSEKNQSEGHFRIEVLFWDDLCKELVQHAALLSKYYATSWADILRPASDTSPIADIRLSYLRAIERNESKRQTLNDIITGTRAHGGIVPLDAVYVEPQIVQAVGMGIVLPTTEALPEQAGMAAPGTLLGDWLAAYDAQNIFFIVEGEMGSGKTELMHRMRKTLATAALADPTAPLPIFLKARELEPGSLDQATLLNAAAKQLPIKVGTLQSLLDHSETRWVYLIDGLDEASPAAWEIVQSVASEPHFRAARVIATSRPVVLPRAGNVQLVLQRWNINTVELFLDRWQTLDATAVRALRSSPHYQDARGDLLANPLTATLCLAIASQHGKLPSSRTAVFMELVEILFQEWTRTRNEGDIRWKDVAPGIREIALRYLRERSEFVTNEALRRAMRTLEPDQAVELEQATERIFGVLVRRDDGRGYDFLFRGLAEHLAGRALLAQGHEAILDAAQQDWGEEAARHSVGIAFEQDGSNASLPLLQALLHQGMPCEKPAHTWLRSLLLCIRAVADIQGLSPEWTRKLLDATLFGLLEEESCWIGDEIANAVRVLASAGGPITQALWKNCYTLMTESKLSPVAWYAAQDKRSAEWWLRVLRHGDADVREVACERLAAYVDNQEVREHLVGMLLDGNSVPAIFPALAAGTSLRKARRDAGFDAIREKLVNLLSHGGQFAAGGAALALLPSEANPAELARALSAVSAGIGEVLAAPVHELAAAAGGQEALDLEWPGWKEKLADTWQYRRRYRKISPTDGLDKCPPLSLRVRRRILWAFASGFQHLEHSEIEAVWFVDPYAYIEELCRAVYFWPAELLPYLRLGGPNRIPIPLDTQRDLGRAAARHSAVRLALLEAAAAKGDWDDAGLTAGYPGLALEALVRRGDSEATKIYADWLPVSVYRHAMPFTEFPYPDRQVLAVPQVKAAALTLAQSIWEHASKGRLEDGKLIRLAPVSAGIALNYLWPAWIDEAFLVDEVSQWLQSGDETEFVAALRAFDRSITPVRVKNLMEPEITARIRAYCGAPTAEFSYVVNWLLAVEYLAIESSYPLLRKLAGMGLEASILATAILIPLLKREDAWQLSRLVAAAGIVPDRRIVAEHHLHVLVGAAPDAWLGLAKAYVHQEGLWSSPVVMRLLRYLPHSHQRELAQTLSQQPDAQLELPWLAFDGWRGPTPPARPADLASLVLFKAGVSTETLN